eukprot:3830225-Pyramimonas_sp.AAC.1
MKKSLRQRRLRLDQQSIYDIAQAFVQLVAHVHRTQELPAQAFTSHAIAIGKKGKFPTGRP